MTRAVTAGQDAGGIAYLAAMAAATLASELRGRRPARPPARTALRPRSGLLLLAAAAGGRDPRVRARRGDRRSAGRPHAARVIWYRRPSTPSGVASRPPFAVIAPHCTQLV